MQHRDLSAGRWNELSVSAQFANIGSEVGRAMSAHEQGLTARHEAALTRAFELIDLTLGNPALRSSARREASRMRELLADYFYGDNSYKTSREQWDRYFTPFAVATNAARSETVLFPPMRNR
ncbi:MAG: hypothetical protein V1712_01280 [Patescibacteria group bacterium]